VSQQEFQQGVHFGRTLPGSTDSSLMRQGRDWVQTG
jgi:hypothetical protein